MAHPESKKDLELSQLLDEALSQLRQGKGIDPKFWKARDPQNANLLSLLETMRHLDSAAESWRFFSTAPTTSLPPSRDPNPDTPTPGTVADHVPEREGDPRDPKSLPPDSLPQAKPLPERIGRYRILRRLGRGGMGTVYQAEDPDLQRTVALKVPRLDRMEDDKFAWQRFVREARAAAKIRHPHVCPIYDVGEHDGVPFVVMAYVEGRSLADRLADGERLADDEAVQLISQVAEALAVVHEQGIIHRDLKPANILLDGAGQAVLTDFGLARPTEDVEHLTAEGTLLGTPRYMAPEQAAGETQRVGIGTDIYSLGVILYELLVGRLPFKGPLASLLYQVAYEHTPPPSQFRENLNKDLERIILKAMARRPEDRYRDARELLRALNEWRTSSNVTIRDTDETKPIAPTSPATVVRSDLPGGCSVKVLVSRPHAASGELSIKVSEQRQTKRKRRRLTVRITVAFSLLFAVVGLGSLAWYGLLGLTLERQSEVAWQPENRPAGEKLFAEAQNERGRVLLEKGDLAQAIAAFQEALRLKKDFPEAHNNLGSALEKKGDLNGAIAACNEALRLKKDFPEAHYNLGKALYAKKNLKGAIDEYQQAIALNPTYVLPYNDLGNVLRDKKDLAGAIAAYQKAITIDPKCALAHINLGAALKAQGDLKGAIACYTKALTLDPKLALAHTNLGVALKAQGNVKGAVASYRKALESDPTFAPAHYNLGVALQAQGDVSGAVACYQKALDLDPKYAKAHNNLGNALYRQGDVKGAIVCYHMALELDPKDALAHNNLGAALADQGDVKGAIPCYQKALDLDPKYAKAHNNLGNALQAQRDLKGAIACYHKALDLDPKYARAYYNLGLALKAQGNLQEAIASYKKSLALDPKYALAHYNLANALKTQGDLKGAIACYKKALDLDPKLAQAHYNLGNALYEQGDVQGAIACFTKALEPDPKDAKVHTDLGKALADKGDLAGAIAAFQEALRLKKDFPEAHCNLGLALLRQGRFTDALAALKQGHQLGSKNPRWLYPSAKWVQNCERLIALDGRLKAVLKQEEKVTPAEGLEFARLCHYKRLYTASARFYQEAFTAQPKWAQDLQRGYRYNAACMAALAGCGKGTDAAKLDAKERARWRQQALDWLRADLALWAKNFDEDAFQQDSMEPKVLAQRVLQHWQQDADLAGVRDDKALMELPEAERAAWQQFWVDVNDLLNKAQGKP
jgi:tetratricopeptide (TPR) repeat protein/predicted Ser/Thr protein kinase